MRTAKEWLDLPEDELGVELARVRTPGPWEHKWRYLKSKHTIRCKKCGDGAVAGDAKSPCSAPDRIDIKDWNVAKHWQGKCNIIRFQERAVDVMREVVADKDLSRDIALQTLALMCRPEDARVVLIIAAMATERKASE